MTYCRGFCINITHDITKSEYMIICNELTDKLNNYYNLYHKDYPFILNVVPERITEGGFQIKFYSSSKNNDVNENDYYKSMRIINTNKFCEYVNKYPFVEQDYNETWINNNDVVYKANKFAKTFLKAFYKANRWNRDELKLFLDVFNKHGIYLVDSFPKDNVLDSIINNYTPLRINNENKNFIKTALKEFKYKRFKN